MNHTEVTELLSDLDAGSLLDQLGHALHEAAKSVVLHGERVKGPGRVALVFEVGFVKNASQVVLKHRLEFKQLTPRGSMTEVSENTAPVHVSARRVSLIPDNQLDMFREPNHD